MLTLAIPQSEPSCDRNRSADFIESVKIADERPLLDAVVDGDGLAEFVELDDVENRSEGLDSENWCVGRHLDDGWLNKAAFPVEHVAAVQGPRHLAPERSQPPRRRCRRPLVDQRTHQDAISQRIANRHVCVGLDQLGATPSRRCPSA